MTNGFPVVFLPSGKRGEFAEGTPLLQAARFLGVDIDSVCGGRGLCGRCQIVCAEGDFPKHGLISKGEHLSCWSETERRFEARKGALTPGRRLSCHTLIQGPLVIDCRQNPRFTVKSSGNQLSQGTFKSFPIFSCTMCRFQKMIWIKALVISPEFKRPW